SSDVCSSDWVLLRLRSGRTRTTATHNTTERLASQNDYGKSWILPPTGSYFSGLELFLVAPRGTDQKDTSWNYANWNTSWPLQKNCISAEQQLASIFPSPH